MKQKVSSKNKILIAASLLGVFLVGAIVSIVLVLAASTQGVASNITVSYNAEGVAAKVSANYAIVPLDTSASVTKTAMTTSGGGQEIVFNLSTSESTETIAPSENIVLNPQNQTVVFEYVFENLADTAFSLSLSQRPTGTNMTEKFLVTGVALDPSDYASAITGSSLATQAVTYLGQKVYVYIMASVANENLTASYNGGFVWNMVSQTRAAYSVTLNNGTGSTGGRTTLPVISTSTVSGIMMPSMSTLPSQSGKIFAGYYSAADGTGTQYYDGNGSPLTTAVTSATTLYAHYTDAYTIETTAEGTVVTNLSDSTAYTQVASGTSFTYGNQTYTTNGEYLMLDPDQSVTITSTTTALAYADGVTVLTEKPSDLATKKFYAAYGAYPQTYVGADLNTTLKSASLTATGKSYTTDINGTTTTLVEYEYNGLKYAKLTSSDANGSNYTFSTGETVADGQTYFFKVEPIVVKAMEVTDTGAKVMTVELLGSKAFNAYDEAEENGEYDNSWKNSDLRSYLNGTFLTESGLSGIAQSITITNEDFYGSSPEGTAVNTIDQIWLPSAEEIFTWTGTDWAANKQTFIDDWYYSDGNDTARRRSPSDMALATYSYYYKTNDAGYYFLRSAGYVFSCVCIVNRDGFVYPDRTYDYPDGGFSPAFYINL